MRTSLADIARLVGGELVGDGKIQITGCSGIQEAKDGDITFLAHAKYLPQAQSSRASAIIIPRQMSSAQLSGQTLIRADNPSLAFTQVLNHFLAQGPDLRPKGIHKTAVIAKDARIAKTAAIGPHCTIGRHVRIGEDCLIYPNVTIYDGVQIGNRVIIHSGTVIGSDGYGYVTVDGKHIKIPQVGTVVIEDDVEIGANVAIDRARFDKTVIGEGTKIDNLVHIAHNVIIGKHCLIVAQVGVSGSARLGNYVVLAGQVGVVGHLTIGDGAVVGAQSGVSKSIKAGEQVFGYPAQPIKEALRTNAHIQRLGQYVETIKDLKKRIEKLEMK